MKTLTSWIILFLFSTGSFAGDPEADQYFPLNGDFAASHILIAHKRAERAKPEVTRSKKEAEAFAKELAQRLASEPELFEELAREHSDGPSGKVGGNLKAFKKGSMAPPFEKALAKLDFGQITGKPVKTQFGFHIIRRNSMEVKHFSASAILAVHKDVTRVKGLRDNAPGLSRSADESKSFIDGLAASVNGANWNEYLDKSDFSGTGFMGVFKPGANSMGDIMIEAVKNLKYGEVSSVVELPIGYALLRRNKVEKRHASRIWIRYKDAKGAAPTVTRTKEEAGALAADLAGQLSGESDGFADLAKQHSDGPFAVRGGKMAPWFAGYQEEAFETACAALEAGQVTSKPVETPSGFFLILKH